MFVQKCKAIVKIFWIFGRGILRNWPSFLTVALLETVTSARCDHARIENLAMFGEFVHYKSEVMFRIALSSQTNIKYNTLRRRFL